MSNSSTLFLSIVGGVIPALIWLLFWLGEDRRRPEPRGLLMFTFFMGMLAVPLVIPFQKLWVENIPSSSEITFFVWAILEEVFKYGAAYYAALRKREMNEPIDALIYMMTAALGFAALENTVFIFHPLSDGNITEGLITGNVRFIGASLLHTISSAAIGVAIALSFYKNSKIKAMELFWGFVAAIGLHTAFNLFIMREHGGTTFAAFGFVWISIIVLMLLFEKVKRVYAVNKIE
ncbi:MAG: hypothetical protein A2741_00715 [Candidatus Zambryskibacteria bacterium RIFCSPHIGHO2_01_FULL_43_27]|uniref:Protease PrsW n=1 Tax=Candidatus Zambryskibacteria bacterium RIFCSPLOWO2_01_FULL_43_17 TaxID=1802760 RepID=A0A1G2U4E8_9BACT|nr:MAG: hypothetical protein A2741_00715 [Candidatus Zambryskibacteria bacterium RIFCSPHIGHO2_01_FULL_43_27]OHB00318.1 MAG: hypothetical protein A3E93_00420 [Candidatus Zambryskibacteria bacterium RIFCSPHIGHO2_12_FULL_43_12b]OHB03790.1 MAG: hypothetical protein A2920_01935 [Candidatus Zambryskibacteria bacterium RIFCSPLOWO2_01_FULL_43_17]